LVRALSNHLLRFFTGLWREPEHGCGANQAANDEACYEAVQIAVCEFFIHACAFCC
jgi:hypothetical protein